MIIKKLFITYFFTFSLVSNAMEGDLCITNIMWNLTTQERTYIGNYPFTRNKGLVTVRADKILQEKLKQMSDKIIPYAALKVIVNRHYINQTIIEGTLSNLQVTEIEESKKNQPGLTWLTPWRDDTIPDTNRSGQRIRYDTLRGGGNRLTLQLKTGGIFRISVPIDADVVVKLPAGDIEYLPSCAQTILHIESSTVNQPGVDGYSAPGKEYWNYYWGPKIESSLTVLKTKKGHIQLP